MTQQTLNPQPLPSQAASESDLAFIASAARQQGTLYAAAAGVVSSSLVFGLSRFSPRFRTSLGVSGKAAIAVTPMFGAFFAKSHLVIASATKDPQGFMRNAPAEVRTPPAREALAPWHTAANIVYDHPCKTIAGVAGPLYAAIFYKESTDPRTAKMLLSQRLIHTRVFGQAVAIGATICVMLFGESMKSDGGRFMVDAEGRLTREQFIKEARRRDWYAKPPEERFVGPTMVHREGDGSAVPAGPNYDLLVPLLYAPLLPLMIIGLRGRVHKDTLTRLVGGTIAVALAHAGTIMFTDKTITMQ